MQQTQLTIPGFEELVGAESKLIDNRNAPTDFAEPVARKSDPETSHSAAADALPRASLGRCSPSWLSPTEAR